MGLLTLAYCRQTLWNFGSDKVYSVATQAQKDEFDLKLNQVVERLLSGMKPRNAVRRTVIPVYNGQITLPRHLEGLLGVRPMMESGCVCHPSTIYSRYHEFTHPTGCDCETSVYYVSDHVQVFRDPAPSFYLRAKSTAADGNITLLGGRDTSWVEYADSVTLAITNGTTTTTRQWNAMPQVQKGTGTKFVDLYSVDTVTGVETQIATYAPGENVPSYQRYTVTNGALFPAVLALAKLCYVPAVADTDIIYPGVLGALKQGLRALNYETKDDDERSAGCWASAYKILDNDLQQLVGEAAVPSFKVMGDYGAGSIVNVL